ncbi:MAG TPA: hypothetical protein VEY92_02645 [Pseudoxanthomonas sp.]|nr:hypothetical protein [Pseudoxanthomonas sp.]
MSSTKTEFHHRTSALTAKRRTIPVGRTPLEWLAIERAATKELQRRASKAHAQILELLRRHATDLSPKQIMKIKRQISRGH